MSLLLLSFRRVSLTFSICALLVTTSCTSSSANGRTNTSLILVKKMVYDNGWKSCGSVLVRNDGSYIYTSINVWSPKQPNEVHRGQLPPGLLAKLADVARSKDSQSVAGTPTYEYFIDDHHHLSTRPEAITALLQTVGSDYH